jgi:hypothetical protein
MNTNTPTYQGYRFPPDVISNAVWLYHRFCGGRFFDTLQNHISKNGHTGKRLIVKIDVEGAEWDSLLATPDAVLDQIDQMLMELHGVNEPRFLASVRRLKEKFYLVNLHFNNWACKSESEPLPADVFQVLWVSKRLGVLDESASRPAPMSALNAPDNPRFRLPAFWRRQIVARGPTPPLPLFRML